MTEKNGGTSNEENVARSGQYYQKVTRIAIGSAEDVIRDVRKINSIGMNDVDDVSVDLTLYCS